MQVSKDKQKRFVGYDNAHQHFVVELLARMPKEQLDGFSQELVERFPNLAETLSSNFEAYLEDRAVLSGRHDPDGAE